SYPRTRYKIAPLACDYPSQLGSERAEQLLFFRADGHNIQSLSQLIEQDLVIESWRVKSLFFLPKPQQPGKPPVVYLRRSSTRYRALPHLADYLFRSVAICQEFVPKACPFGESSVGIVEEPLFQHKSLV